MSIQQKEHHEYRLDRRLLEQATQAMPQLRHRYVAPQSIVTIVPNAQALHGWKITAHQDVTTLSDRVFHQGDEIILDFGQPYVGTIALTCRPVGSPPDAPLFLRLTFGEMPTEVKEDFSTYHGWISRSWLQQETLHVDVLPQVISLPRRYSFRYLKIEVLDTSPKYGVSFDQIEVRHQTSADRTQVPVYQSQDPLLQQMDTVSLKTLENCMQTVFEDGPKRDRRLWLGDLRLQALANYETFQNNELVKRCLLLFAGSPDHQGRVSANVFIQPDVIPDDTYLYDYSLMFAVTLTDYYQATGDRQTLETLWPTAIRQVELALENLDEHALMIDHPNDWWAFFDWHEELNKQACAQAVLIYTLERVIPLTKALAPQRTESLITLQQQLKTAAKQYLWDPNQQLFVSGQSHQVSWASQVWMVLANVVSPEAGRQLFTHIHQCHSAITMVTPYMHHYLVEALLHVGMKQAAEQHLRDYWGGMIHQGADTFWELYDPDDPGYSPYGSPLINSYCHAWSCTPTYFLRRMFNSSH